MGTHLEYEAPRLTVEGRLGDLTGQNTTGTHLDQNEPQNTPSGQLLFS